MTTSRTEIVGTMTIGEAAPNWPDPRREHLKHWANTFAVRLQDLHIGHIRTYQQERGEQVPGSQVDVEVDAVLGLLKQIGLGKEILSCYQSLTEARELTPAELNSLPESVQRYIAQLKREISELRANGDRMTNQIRRTNWGRSR